MTGFGSAEGNVLGGRLSIEIRSVNHRYYNPQLKLPFELGGVEGPLRERLRQLLERGHVTVSARWIEAPQRDGAVAVDLTRARQLVAAAKELKKRLKLKGDVDLAFVARQPEVLTSHQDGIAAAQWSEVEPIAERAVGELLGMRAREGAALAAELGGRLRALETGAGTIEQRAPDRLTAELARLKKAVAELAAGVQVDEQRLAVEVALLECRPPRASSCSPPRPEAARRPSRASCGRGCPTLSGTRCPRRRARRDRASETAKRIISSRATSSSGGVRRVSSSSRPSMRGSCTARFAARSHGCCAAESMWCWTSR